jgi:hypothetical protein
MKNLNFVFSSIFFFILIDLHKEDMVLFTNAAKEKQVGQSQ